MRSLAGHAITMSRIEEARGFCGFETQAGAQSQAGSQAYPHLVSIPQGRTHIWRQSSKN